MELQTFNFETQEVRTAIKNNEPWFVGKDVAEILGYKRPTKAISDHVDEEDRDEVPIQDSKRMCIKWNLKKRIGRLLPLGLSQ